MFFPFCQPTSSKCSDYETFYANCQKMRLQWLKATRDRLQVHLAAINAAIGELETQIEPVADSTADSAV